MRRAHVALILGVLMILSGPATVTAAADHASTGAGASSRATLWASRYDGIGLQDVARGVVASPDGSRVFVTGHATFTGSDSAFVTIAYDATAGGQAWVARYDGPGGSCTADIAQAIAISPDGGRVFVTGPSCGVGGQLDYATVAYDAASGGQLWATRFVGGDESVAIGVSPDGSKVYVTGDDVNKWHTIAYDAGTGAQLWLTQYVGGGLEPDLATGLRVSPNGAHVYVCGYFWSGHDYTAALVSYDEATGVPEWTATYEGPVALGAYAYAIAVSGEGARVFLTGAATIVAGAAPIYGTEAFDATTGSLLWATTYDGPGAGTDQANTIGVSPDSSRVYVTGSSWGSSSRSDYATVAYDAATGTQVWVSRYDGPSSNLDSANALAVGPTGSLVYVTGQSAGSGTAYDYATLALRASTGATSWLVRYDGPAGKSDIANGIAVSPNGRTVFVTGQSRGSGTGDDYATIARIS